MEFKDQIGNTIKLGGKPKRVISIVPSQSEFLWEIGLRDELVGITKFCVHPNEMFSTIERVGGTKKLHIDKIRALKPDLIIGNKEENEQADIEVLQKEFNVWISDIYNFEDSFKMMIELGIILGKETETNSLVSKIKKSLLEIKDIFSNQKVAYFIWKSPYMLAASNTFIDFVLNYIGLNNSLSGFKRYPELIESALKELKIDYCFLSSEPFPFNENHVKDFKNMLPHAKIFVVDGEVFSWYGSRLLHLNVYIKDLKQQINA